MTTDELTQLDEQADLMEALNRRDCVIDRETLRDLIVTARLARRLSGQPARIRARQTERTKHVP